MSHEVETMAWANAVPWHGLGKEVDPSADVDTWAHEAGIDWTVSLEPIYTKKGKALVEVPDRRALVRSDTGAALTVTGKRWKPVQNVEAMKFFKEFVGAGGAQMETVGSLRGGRVVWGLASLNDKFYVGTDKSDPVKGYLLLMSPHELGRSTIGKVTATRVVCANTMAVAMDEHSGVERRWDHTQEFDPIAAAEAMGLVREDFFKFGKVAQQLRRLKLSEGEVYGILAPISMPAVDPADVASGKVEKTRQMAAIMESYLTAPGAQPGTGWGVLNGFTHWADHVAGRNPDSRLSAAWMGASGDQKQRVLDSLLERV